MREPEPAVSTMADVIFAKLERIDCAEFSADIETVLDKAFEHSFRAPSNISINAFTNMYLKGIDGAVKDVQERAADLLIVPCSAKTTQLHCIHVQLNKFERIKAEMLGRSTPALAHLRCVKKGVIFCSKWCKARQLLLSWRCCFCVCCCSSFITQAAL